MAAKIPVIKFTKDNPKAYPPIKRHPDAAGYDLAVMAGVILFPSRCREQCYALGTGLCVDIPDGYYGTIHLRTTWASATNVRLVGSGIINPSYKGELILYVENIGNHDQRIGAGQYIAEIVFHKIENVKVEVKD